jgi:hypothetical protein
LTADAALHAARVWIGDFMSGTWTSVSPYLGVAALFLALVSLFLLLFLARRVTRFARPFDALVQAAESASVGDLLQAQLQGVERNSRRIEETLAYTRHLRTQAMNALQGIGFLRYDAFDDIRGQQSFSVCMLDAHLNGLLVTSIAGRMDSRTYAKPVRDGQCDTAISDEETRAIVLARESLSEAHEPVVAGL